MEIHLSPDLPESPHLKPFDAVEIGQAEQKGELFSITLGLDAGSVAELRKLSLDTSDPALQENTSDLKRFGTGSYEEWYAKKRFPFALVHKKTGALAAFVWFGPKELGRKSMKHLSAEELAQEKEAATGDWHTIAFRSYPPFRGTGIMKEFVRTATDVYLKYFPEAKLWTSNNRANTASVGLSEKLGYKIDESLSDKETVTMVR
jgi:RimJ/RimL family protein N-acetyltransferase